MSEAFGGRLRAWREGQNVPLRAIADQTKISVSLLEGLERDDLSHWPGGIFRRAFVRAYAQALGLDPDATLREFLERHPDPAADPFTALAAATSGQPKGAVERFRAALGATVRSHADPPTPPDPRPIVDPPRREPANPEPAWQPDLAAVARLCTALGCVEQASDLAALLQQAATILDATGIVLWAWDPDGQALHATLAHGYSAAVLAQVPSIEREADNAIAAAFRLGETCVVASNDRANGALAVPLMTAAGCAGVLGLELRHGRERHDAARAAASIVAAQLATMVRVPSPAAADRKLA